MAYELGNVSKLYNQEGGIALAPLPGTPVKIGTDGQNTRVDLHTKSGYGAPAVLSTHGASFGLIGGGSLYDDVVSFGYNYGPAGKIVSTEPQWGMQFEAQYASGNTNIGPNGIVSEWSLNHINPASTVNSRPLHMQLYRDDPRVWSYMLLNLGTLEVFDPASTLPAEHPKYNPHPWLLNITPGAFRFSAGLMPYRNFFNVNVPADDSGPSSSSQLVLVDHADSAFYVNLAADPAEANGRRLLSLSRSLLRLDSAPASADATLRNSIEVFLPTFAWNGSGSVEHGHSWQGVAQDVNSTRTVLRDAAWDEKVRFCWPTDGDVWFKGDIHSGKNSGRLYLKSADGTRYYLEPPNGGGAAVWVAG